MTDTQPATVSAIPPTAFPVRSGGPIIWLRLEGLAVLIAAVLSYAHGHHSWILFAVLLLLPDISFAGYLAGPRIGAMCYNLLHSYASALLLAAVLFATGSSPAIALIWIAHIDMDRALGYGLKYASSFNDTHLGKIGK